MKQKQHTILEEDVGSKAYNYAYVKELESENKRLRLAFQNYGRHINDERMLCATFRDSGNDCDCGYDSTGDGTK